MGLSKLERRYDRMFMGTLTYGYPSHGLCFASLSSYIFVHMPLLQWLDEIDKMLFVLVQHHSDSRVLDVLMPIVREPLTWIPFYAFMLYYAFRVGRSKAWAFVVLS